MCVCVSEKAYGISSFMGINFRKTKTCPRELIVDTMTVITCSNTNNAFRIRPIESFSLHTYKDLVENDLIHNLGGRKI